MPHHHREKCLDGVVATLPLLPNLQLDVGINGEALCIVILENKDDIQTNYMYTKKKIKYAVCVLPNIVHILFSGKSVCRIGLGCYI